MNPTRFLLACSSFLSVTALAGSPPVLKSIGYLGGNTGNFFKITNTPAPEPAVVRDLISFCGDNLWVEGQTQAWIGARQLLDLRLAMSGCVSAILPPTPLSGRVKITTPYGTTSSSQIIQSVIDPRASKCKMSVAVSGKWGDVAKTSLMATLTFKNTGTVDCWLFEPEARGQWLVGASLIVSSDQPCYVARRGNGASIDRFDPKLPKITLAPGKSFSSTFDVLKLESYEKIDCAGTPNPTKMFMIYRTGVHEVSVKSPPFEGPW